MSFAAPLRAPREKPRASPKGATATRSLRGDLKQFTRDKIIAAALDAFAERGFRNTTVERIVELAGTTAPTFYRHFTGKADLAAPLQSFLVKEVTKVVKRLDSPKPRTVEDIRAWVWSYWEMWRRLKRLCAAYWEATSVDEDFAAQIMPETLRVADSLSDYLAALPVDRREKFRLRLAVLLAMLDRLVHHAGSERDPIRSKAMLDEFAEIFWLSLYAPSRDMTDGVAGA